MKGLSHEQRRDRRQQIAEYCKTNTAKAASQVWGVSQFVVRDACKEFGVTAMSPKHAMARPVKVSTLVVIARLQAGESQTDIADALGVSRQNIQQIRMRAIAAGIKLP